MARYIVAMSGGVDSAVAASLLVDAGHDVEGLFMANWEDDGEGYCTTAADFQDARRSCAVIGIPLHRVSFAAEYRERVFAHFLAELRAGRTPNPDVLCNREIKFGLCLGYARRLGGERFATGHYARIASGGRLLRAVDAAKDQSYFLHMLRSSELAGCDFPLGSLCKREVRAIARERGLPVFDKRDSTGICFIGERPFGDFLQSWLPAVQGPIETPDGEVIGRHLGLARYTLGQRSGLGVGGLKDRAAAPWFVAGKDLARNALIVVQGRDHPALHCGSLSIGAPHWISGQPPAAEFECTVKLRYRQPDSDCRVRLRSAGADVRFVEPQAGAVPGQYAVFYRGEECLGGGVIVSLIMNAEDPCRTVSRRAASSRSVTAATSTTAWTRCRNTRSRASPIR
ncbi:MAG: tRNA 2-thiouridine(34) synthase MnmA [Steroidobacteraceae bacterium]